MPFFLRGTRSEKKSKVIQAKRKRTSVIKTDKNKNIKPNRPDDLDEEITSEEDEDYLRKKFQRDDDYEDAEEDETPQEKKVRLAKQYLQELKDQRAQDADGDEWEDNEAGLGQVLRDDVLEAAGRLYKPFADKIQPPDSTSIRILKCKQQKLPIICIAVTTDEKYIYSGSKDSCIIKWSFEGKKLGFISNVRKGKEGSEPGHTSHIYSIAVSSDGKFLASGDELGFINIWDGETLQHLKRFKKNRSAISGLVFRQGTHTLYSSSHDRNVMVWNLSVMAFVEHLGGHAAAITGIDALSREACITSGGRDESVIIYQIVEDKQLLFNAKQGSIDGLKLLNDKTFVTFGQDGSLALWTTLKKKPHYVVREAHGRQENSAPRWLTAVTAHVNSDVVATGSSDGFVRLWKVTIEDKKIMPLLNIPVNGFINSLAFTTSGSHLVAGVGQEHKLGRWYKDKSCKNSVVIIPLKRKVS